jgi:hypothetical protein
MARFSANKLHFGDAKAGPDDDGEGLPTPVLVRLKARRAAGIAEARAVLANLPGECESLHCVCTARMDLTDVINALVEKLGRCERLLIATLGYNRKNLQSLLGWLDEGKVTALSLLASRFFRSHNGELWEHTQAELRQRGGQAACCYSHAKVVTLAFVSGQRLSIEGSSNLCGNGSGREQFALINDAGLHAWHSAWISDQIVKHDGEEETANGR